jgi:CoA:oxalate CoA-transferase
VLKIERPEGDESRRMTLYSYGPMSAFFVPSNRNKRSRVLDLGDPAGRAELDELLESADVVIDNFKPDTLRRLGLDYKTLSERNPRVVSVSITGYGEGSPEADSPAYDLLAQARAGVIDLTGEASGRPVKAGVPIGDLLAGVYAAVGTVAALYERDRTGNGQRVEVAMLDAQIAMVHYHFSYFDASGEVLQRVGSEHHNMVPYGIYQCSDGFIAIAVTPEPPKFWTSLCTALDHPEWASDERFATATARVSNREALKHELEAALGARTRRDWYDVLRSHGVPAAPVNGVSDLLADEQVAAREMLVELTSPSYGTVRVPGNPIKMRGARPIADWLVPPMLGEGGDNASLRGVWPLRSHETGADLLNTNFMAPGSGEDVAVLLGWRCAKCSALALGKHAVCGICGNKTGRVTQLANEGVLETWSRIATRKGGYIIGYALVGDGEDDRRVRIFGPIDAVDESILTAGERIAIRFRRSDVNGKSRLHHTFIPAQNGSPRAADSKDRNI